MLLRVIVTPEKWSMISLSNSMACEMVNADPARMLGARVTRMVIESTGPPGGGCLTPFSNVPLYHARETGGITSKGRQVEGTITSRCKTEMLAFILWSSICDLSIDASGG